MPDKVSQLKHLVSLALKDFSGDVPEPDASFPERVHRPESGEFPVPDLVLFALRNVMSFASYGPGEKVRWTVYCRYQGVIVGFEMRKFGFTILLPEHSEIDVERLKRQLRKAVQLVEKALQPFAREQMQKGNVTLKNRYGDFERRYRFFRDLADNAYREANSLYAPSESGADFSDPAKELTDHFNRIRKAEYDGYFHSVAMVEAYFSRLEHQLVLMLAFVESNSLPLRLLDFIGMKWDMKLKRFIDVEQDKAAKKIYTELKHLKERIRNPFAHGGFEKDWASLYFHLPTIGALPACLSDVRDSMHFKFTPVESADHQEACRIFDQFDEYIRTGLLKKPQAMIESGIDVSFDQKSLESYSAAMKSETEMEDFIDAWHRLDDMHANMDY